MFPFLFGAIAMFVVIVTGFVLSEEIKEKRRARSRRFENYLVSKYGLKEKK
jgi:hypothetical protein